MGDAFDITYAAHTASCTFLLDRDGICRRIVMIPRGKRRDASKNAARCVGAQYVATLDPAVPGCLVELPKVGAAMLFARVDEAGRIALVRTGVVTSFETNRVAEEPDPFRESFGVITSAPRAEDLHVARTPRVRSRQAASSAAAAVADPYVEASDRTQQLPALRRQDELDASLLSTDEYESQPVATERMWPSAAPVAHTRTLHDPKVQLSPVEDPDDPYVERAQRGMLPRPAGEDAFARTRQNRAGETVPKSRNSWPKKAVARSTRRGGQGG